MLSDWLGFLLLGAIIAGGVTPMVCLPLAWWWHRRVRALRIAVARARPLSSPVPGRIMLTGRLRREDAKLWLEGASGTRVLVQAGSLVTPESVDVTVIGDARLAGRR
jgi:hypothetical protein